MSFATIGGVTYDVQKDGTIENEPEKIGQVRRAFAGNPRSSEKYEKGVFQLTLAPILVAAYVTLRTNIALSKLVACTGDFNGGVALNYYVRMVSCGYHRPNLSEPMRRIPVLELHQQ